MATLVVQTGKNQGMEISLPPDRELVIGRDEASFLRMGASDVSRQHCVLKVTERGVLVKDLGSQNGTLVNGLNIVKATLMRPGDRLRVGHTEFLVEPIRPEADSMDDSILDWLHEGETPPPHHHTGHSTVVVKGSGSNSGGTDSSSNASPANAPPGSNGVPVLESNSTATPGKKRHGSVREEAHAVIREHFESRSEPLPERFRDKNSAPPAAGESHPAP